MQKTNISAVILSKNNESTIFKLINMLDFCFEVIVIDDNSRDETREIAKKAGALVIKHKLNGDFSNQRNYALKKSKGNWILFIDTDEWVNDKLKKEIINAVRNEKYDAYKILRINIFQGVIMNYSETGKSKIIRLARKNYGNWERKVHERWIGKGKVGNLKNPLYHDSIPNLKEFIDKINRYSVIHAQENYREGKKSNLLKVVFWPTFKFLNNYFLRLGILDGNTGFINSMLLSFHSFLSWSNLYLWQKQKKQ